MKMVKTGEGFFSSLGFKPLPDSFYERSMFTKPADREVVCHASAWDIDNKDDIRIKMCIKVNGDDFTTIHHELGHNYYQRAYNKQSYLHLDGANDGFHEAIGDAVALSITPEYLVQVGLLDADKVPSARRSSAPPMPSIRVPNIISRATRPIRAISSRGSCSSSSTRPLAMPPAGRARCTAAPSTATKRSVRS